MDLKSLTNNPHLGQYKKQAKELLKAWRSSDAEALSQGRQHHPRFSERINGKLALSDAQLVLARQHGFESWPKFASHVAELEKRLGTEFLFETAVDAVVDGALDKLKHLLAAHPELVQRRSSRTHRARLLHYVAANGVENYRQRSPKNAVAIAQALLDAGADVFATASAYKGDWSVLGLLVSSIHPHLVGTQIDLTRLLLDRGAGSREDLLLALAFGYYETAAVIAAQVGVDNLLSAAGLGELDLVLRWCKGEGNLSSECALVAIPGQPQLKADAKTNCEQALIWAARLGHSEVVRVLLASGVDPAAKGGQGFSAAHWAAVYGRCSILENLVSAGAPLELENAYGGTVLSTAVFAATHPDMHFEGGCAMSRVDIDYTETVATLLQAGARVDVPMHFPTNVPRLDSLLRRYGAHG